MTCQPMVTIVVPSPFRQTSVHRQVTMHAGVYLSEAYYRYGSRTIW
jgi:hypothetical protein